MTRSVNNPDNISLEFAAALREKLSGGLKKIVLFGSQARGDFTPASDYDFLIVVDKKEKKVRETILDSCVDIMNRHYALVGCLIYDEREWRSKQRYPLGHNILKEGIEL